ncbi:MAG: hypothetical protein U0V73_04685 [Acidimicrobiia bacterium]
MALVAAIAVLGVVVVVAAVFVGREARRLTDRPMAPIFSEDEAYEWVVEELPDIVAATLTPDDVRRILRLQTEYLEHRGVTSASVGSDGADVVVDAGELERFVIDRAAAQGEAYLPEQVSAVIETQLRYLHAIGAVGPEAGPPDGP